MIRISVSIDYSYFADLKKGNYSTVMKCADDTKRRNLVNTR